MILIFTLFYLTNQVYCNDLNLLLLSESVLYGLSSLTNNIANGTKSKCERDLQILYDSVNEKHDWALKVLDASGQPESSFLFGNNIWLGSQTFCIDMQNKAPLKLNYEKLIHKPINNNTYPPYPLSFMAAYIKHNNTLQQHTRVTVEDTIYLGLCIPHTCDTEEMKVKLSEYFTENYLYVQQLYNLGLEVKSTKLLREDFIWFFKLPKVYCGIIVFALYIVVIVCGTCYGLRNPLKDAQNDESQDANLCYQEQTTSCWNVGNFLRCFDLGANIKSILTTKTQNSSKDTVKCVDGIRFYLMYYAILGHAVLYKKDFVRNPAASVRMSETFLAQITANGVYVVDGFLFIGGFLLGYTFFKRCKMEMNSIPKKQKDFKQKAGEFVTVLVMRFVRITPAYLVIIYLTNIVFTYLREIYPIHFPEQPDVNCDLYWWRNVLFINNLYPRSELCLSWSYYLSNDMQFFILSLFLLLLSKTHFKLVAFTTVALILGSIGVNAYIFYKINYVPTLDEFLERLDIIYDLPWCRINPYLIGLITSYILMVKLENKLNLNKTLLGISWIFFPMLSMWVLFGLYGNKANLVYSVFYMSMSKTVWAIGLSWAVIACHTNNGGVFNRFFSLRIWTPLNRMSLCVYLLNPLIHVAFTESSNNYSNFSIATCTIDATALFTLTYFMAIFVTALFEYPFIRILHMYIKFNNEKLSRRNNNDLNTKKIVERYSNGNTTQ